YALAMITLVGFALSGLALAFLSAGALFVRLGWAGKWAGRKVFGSGNARVKSGYQRSGFGYVIQGVVGNPVMPLVMVAAVFVFVGTTLIYFINNNKGVEFFVETEAEQAIVYVLARGNLSLDEKDALLRQAEAVVINHPGIRSAFAFAGNGGLNANTGGAGAPADAIGQIQLETIPWEERPESTEAWFTIPILNYTVEREIKAHAFEGASVMEDIGDQLAQIPGIKTEALALAQGPAQGKPVHLRLKGDNFDELMTAAGVARAQFDVTPGLVQTEDTRPLPGIDWQIDVDVEKAGRYGADVATVGAMVQLVTRGIWLDNMRVDSSDEEIEIRVRLPEEDRVLSTLDTLKVRTGDGLVPLANFITRTPVAELAQISRVDQVRYFDVKADVIDGLQKLVTTDDEGVEVTAALLRPSPSGDITFDDGTTYTVFTMNEAGRNMDLQAAINTGAVRVIAVNANERIAELTKWLDTDPLTSGIEAEWTGDQEEQAESGAFLGQAFLGALGL
ncbi:MAG: efflux RND transporter permease subunit, partial [Pseudomonadota bacterium]